VLDRRRDADALRDRSAAPGSASTALAAPRLRPPDHT